MQKNWQRRHNFVALNRPTLNAMLQPAFPGKSVIEAELLTAGLCNTNYKIRMSDITDAFVLRLYIRDFTACQKDRDIFNLVHNHVPVPELLYTDVAGEHFDTPYSVMKWVDGILLSEIIMAGDVSQMIACAHAVGTTLARIGTYTFPQPGFFGPELSIAQPFDRETSPFLTIMESFLFKGRTGQRLGTALTNQLWQFVISNKEYLTASEAVADLVHSDFKGVNLLVKQEKERWQVASVLDWEFAFAGSPLVDIANMLRYASLLPAEFETQFIHGYLDQGGKLPTEWKKTAKLLDLLSLCEFLNAPNPDNAQIAEVTGLIVRTFKHWEEYSRK